MSKSTRQTTSRTKSASIGKKTGSAVASVIAIVFTLMPIVTIGMWTTQSVDSQNASEFIQAVLEVNQFTL